MNLGKRIFKIGEHWVKDKLEGAFSPNPARDELEEYLRNPSPPPRQTPNGSTTAGRAAPPPHPYAREYRLLGVAVGADLVTVQKSWRRLVRENHPDRFAGDPPAQARATERLLQINEAYDRLRKYLDG